MTQKKTIIGISASVCVLFILFSGAWEPYRWGMERGAWLETMPITFYGRVVDLKNNPLADAKVNVEIDKANLLFIFGGDHWLTIDKYELITDKDGRFSMSGYHGRSVTIRTITKPGFIYHYYDNPNAEFFYYQGQPIYKPDPDHPALLRLRHTNE
jgi:hypothetical protein